MECYVIPLCQSFQHLHQPLGHCWSCLSRMGILQLCLPLSGPGPAALFCLRSRLSTHGDPRLPLGLAVPWILAHSLITRVSDRTVPSRRMPLSCYCPNVCCNLKMQISLTTPYGGLFFKKPPSLPPLSSQGLLRLHDTSHISRSTSFPYWSVREEGTGFGAALSTSKTPIFRSFCLTSSYMVKMIKYTEELFF